jgi:hypothetical protein
VATERVRGDGGGGEALDLGHGAAGEDVVADRRGVLDGQPGALQPRAHGALRRRRQAEASGVAGGRQELVVVGARAVEEPVQQGVLAERIGVGERDADPHRLRRGGGADARGLRQVAQDVGDEDAVAGGCGGHRGRGGQDGQAEQAGESDARERAHGRSNAPEAPN